MDLGKVRWDTPFCVDGLEKLLLTAEVDVSETSRHWTMGNKPQWRRKFR